MPAIITSIVAFLHEHWILSIAFIVVLILVIIFELIHKARQAPKLSVHQAIHSINRESGVVLDVRKKDVFVRGHIAQSINIALNDLKQNIKKLEEYKNKPIIVVCAQGMESSKAVGILEEEGFEQVKVLNGGLQAWRAENLPVVKN